MSNYQWPGPLFPILTSLELCRSSTTRCGPYAARKSETQRFLERVGTPSQCQSIIVRRAGKLSPSVQRLRNDTDPVWWFRPGKGSSSREPVPGDVESPQKKVLKGTLATSSAVRALPEMQSGNPKLQPPQGGKGNLADGFGTTPACVERQTSNGGFRNPPE